MACDVIEGRLKAPGGVIYEDDDWLVDHSLSPVVLKGWLIIKPKRHVEHFAELTPQEAARFGPLARLTCLALTRALAPERVYLCSFGELVHHVHVYLVPRYEGMPESGLDVLPIMFSDERPWACTDEEAAAAAAAVRNEMSRLLA